MGEREIMELNRLGPWLDSIDSIEKEAGKQKHQMTINMLTRQDNKERGSLFKQRTKKRDFWGRDAKTRKASVTWKVFQKEGTACAYVLGEEVSEWEVG